MNAVIFDLDGTLIDSLPDIRTSLNSVLTNYGYQSISVTEVKNMIGRGSEVLLKEAFQHAGAKMDSQTLASCVKSFTSHYERNSTSKTKVFPGALSALQTLSARGIKMGVCTNKPHAIAHTILESLGLDKYFPVCIGKGKLPHHKPDSRHYNCVAAGLNVKPQETLYVGDSETDVKTARNAGVPIILVSHGYSKKPANTLGGDLLINHFSEMPNAIDKLFATMRPVL